jgi:hypothetical protein
LDTASVLLICKVIHQVSGPTASGDQGSNRLYASAQTLKGFFDLGVGI